jgi:phage FluMu protein Com
MRPHRAADATARGHVFLNVRCAHCQAALQLECEGLPGFWGYETYNEYFCPQCRKQNHQRSSGAIVSARLAR